MTERTSRRDGRRRPRLRCLLAAVAIGLGCALALAAAERATDFLEAIADLPLMPGLHEVEDAGLVFDKPGGRIVEAYAKGAVEGPAVLDFYRRTLPQLGWRAEGAAVYRREGERLIIDLEPADGLTTVRFTLAPQ